MLEAGMERLASHGSRYGNEQFEKAVEELSKEGREQAAHRTAGPEIDPDAVEVGTPPDRTGRKFH